jgi:hypothetical protein
MSKKRQKKMKEKYKKMKKLNKSRNLPLVMIWFGSKDSSVSCSPTHAYKVRTCVNIYHFCEPGSL